MATSVFPQPFVQPERQTSGEVIPGFFGLQPVVSEADLEKTLTVFLAGGQGSRLAPIAKVDLENPEQGRPKPFSVLLAASVPTLFIPVSDAINSGFKNFWLSTQKAYESMNQGFMTLFDNLPDRRKAGIHTERLEIKPDPEVFIGTAGTVYEELQKPEYSGYENIAIFSTDHAYRMRQDEFLKYHLDNKADMTVSTIPVLARDAGSLGIMRLDEDGEVLAFAEKLGDKIPAEFKFTGEDGQEYCWASMGNYIIDRHTLTDTVQTAKSNGIEKVDFGYHVLPAMAARPDKKLFAFKFSDSHFPGMSDTSQGYWKDIGKLDDYFEVNVNDCLGDEHAFDPFNRAYPLYSHLQAEIKRVKNDGLITNAIVPKEHHALQGKVDSAVISESVTTEAGSNVIRSILLPGAKVGRNARVEEAIIGHEVIIPDGAVIDRAFGEANQGQPGITVTEKGRVAIAREFDFSQAKHPTGQTLNQVA
ncbi:MAG: sugar phosphate nucleotidyltransferase [Candidatus Melainabacteria bacterium]